MNAIILFKTHTVWRREGQKREEKGRERMEKGEEEVEERGKKREGQAGGGGVSEGRSMVYLCISSPLAATIAFSAPVSLHYGSVS